MDNHRHAADEFADRGTDSLPNDLAAVHGRLREDVARWESRVPAPDSLLRWLDHEMGRRAHAQAHDAPESSFTAADIAPTHASWNSPSRAAPAISHRAQGVAAVLAAVVVVALLAGVLAQLGRGRGTTARQPAPTATPLVVRQAQNPHDVQRGVWTPLPRLTFATETMNSAGLIALAPSDPRVVYEARLNADGTGSLRRTRDGGTSWTTLAIPTTRSALQDIAVEVSPLDAGVVYLTLTDKTAPDPGASCPEMGPGAMLPCGLAYISIDGGAHWRRLALPVPGVFTAPQGQMAATGFGVFQTQGTRIYALAGCGATCGGVGTGQLVRSADGGRTWRQADSDLARVTYECAFAAAPTGTTIFAATSTRGCENESAPALALWRSDDAGAHWSAVTNALPGNDLRGMIATAQPGATTPLLYLNLSQATPANNQIIEHPTPASVQVSADGGKTWQSAPLAGALDTTTAVGPLAALPDGTVIAFQYRGDGNGRVTDAVPLGWKRGQPAWHALTPPLPSPPSQLVLTTYSDGQPAIWAVAGTGPRVGMTMTFGVTEYLP